MKRFVSFIMIFVILAGYMVSFSGCESDNRELSMGQWLGMINNAFGMESYSNEQPYVATVSTDDEYFSTIQIAAEWEVIDAKAPIDPRESVLWKDALVTLVNAGAFTASTASEEEKIQYAIEHFDPSIRTYWMKRKITVSSATVLLVKAQELWANKTYDVPVEKVDYAEDVVDISQTESNVIVVDPITETVILSEDASLQIQEGDMFVLPTDAGDAGGKAYRAEKVETADGKVKIAVSDDFELGDVVDELYVENTYYPDLSTAEIYDGNGNLVQSGGPSVSQLGGNTGPQLFNLANGANIVPLAQKTSFSFTTDSCEVEVSVEKDGLSAKIEIPLNKDETWKGSYEVEVSNFKVTNKIDYSWFKLHSAEVKVDYKTKSTIAFERSILEKQANYAPKWSNRNGKFLTNLKNSVWKNDEAKGAKTIKLGSIKVASVGVASFSVDVHAKIKVDGSIEISCTEVGCKGIEYKKGNCRVINTSDKDRDVQFKCKAEGTVSVGPTVNAFGFAIIGLSAEVGLGAQASVTLHLADPGNHLLEEMSAADIPPEVYEATDVAGLTADVEAIKELAEAQGGTYEVETSTVDLHLDVCIDINVYFILRVGLEETTLAGKLLKGTKVKVSWEICNSKNAKICNLHIENFDFISAFKNIKFFTAEGQCTLEYEPFDKVEEEETTEETTVNDEDTSFGEVLMISTMKIVLAPNETATLSVSQIPHGYELKDIACKSENEKIATIDKNGVVQGKENGSTTIIVSTTDGKYVCACSVTVSDEAKVEFVPMDYDSMISEAGGYVA